MFLRRCFQLHTFGLFFLFQLSAYSSELCVSFYKDSVQRKTEPKVETISSYNGETTQNNAQVYYPSNVGEVQTIIRNALKTGQKVRFSGSSHSTSSLILGPGVYVKNSSLNKIIGLKKKGANGAIVEVESGVKVADLVDYLEKHGYSLGFAYPYYNGLTIGGLLATGSHGSSRKHRALSSQNIVEMTLIDGRGDVVVANKSTPKLLKAARVNLGLLGFVHKIQLRVVPDFNIRFTNQALEGATALLSTPGKVNWGRAADTEYHYWFPALDRSVKVSGDITKDPVMPGAKSVVLGQNNDPVRQNAEWLALSKGQADAATGKVLEDRRFETLSKGPPSYIYLDAEGKEVRANGVVGKSAAMLISKRIPLNPVYTTEDISFSFPMKDAPKVMTLIHEFSAKNEFYHPFLGVFLRFVRADGSTYLSHIERAGDAPGNLFVMAEFFEVKKYDSAVEDSRSVQLRHKLVEALTAQNLVSFHWGKNTDQIFAIPSNVGLIGADAISEFDLVRKSMDPYDVFTNDFAESVLLKEK